MIAIIYIPHQMPPSVDFYHDDDQILNAAFAMACNDDDAPEDFDDVDEAIEYLGHDMNSSIVIRSYDEIESLNSYKSHQWPIIQGSITRKLYEEFENFTTEGQVVAKAREDAELFTDEFPGLNLNNHGDWDSQAWEETARQMGLSPEEEEFHWPRYREALISEINKLNAV